MWSGWAGELEFWPNLTTTFACGVCTNILENTHSPVGGNIGRCHLEEKYEQRNEEKGENAKEQNKKKNY
jgi:hypothetical protein